VLTGNYNSTAGVLGQAASTDSWLGFVFDLSGSYSTESERSLALEPPIFNYFEITLYRTNATANTGGEMFVFFVPEFVPLDYNNSRDPGQRNEWLIGYENADSFFTNADSLTIPIGGNSDKIDPTTIPVEWSNSTRINSEDIGDLNANWGRFQSYVRNSQWTGRVAFTVYLTVDSGITRFYSTEGTGTQPGMVASEHKFHSGQIGLPMRRRARVRHDPKSGFPGLSDEFIPDGYREGLMVLPDSWDPEDRTNMDFFPPPSEGVVDDEVP
jgi:hypothetical protein